MRTTTNFFLANLALADLSVGIFCMLPNLGLYLSPHWMLGKVMCKLLYFVQMMAYAASIIILTVISVERYFAILHPFRCKQWKTLRLLRIIVLLIWLASAICGIPQMIFYNTVTVPHGNGNDFSDFCIVLMSHNKKAYVTTNFVLWYIVPLTLMTIMYSRISVVLWRTSRLGKASDRSVPTWTWKSSKQHCQVDQTGKVTLGFNPKETSSSEPVSNAATFENESTISMSQVRSSTSPSPDSDSLCTCFTRADTNTDTNQERAQMKVEVGEIEVENDGCCSMVLKKTATTEGGSGRTSNSVPNENVELRSLVPRHTQGCLKNKSIFSKPPANPLDSISTGKTQRFVRFSPEDRTDGALLARRRVIRLLIVVIVCFALCVLPYHVLMMCQTWLEYNMHHTYGQMLASPIIFLIFYLNSALNPLLYAFLSDNFRRSLQELVRGQASNVTLNRARHGTLTCKTMNSSV